MNFVIKKEIEDDAKCAFFFPFLAKQQRQGKRRAAIVGGGGERRSVTHASTDYTEKEKNHGEKKTKVDRGAEAEGPRPGVSKK